MKKQFGTFSNSHLLANKISPDTIFSILVSIFTTLLILTNLIAGKYFSIFQLPLSCANLIYPFTFLVTDIVTEIYGIQHAKLLTYCGIIATLTTTLLIWLADKLPIAPFSPISQSTFSHLFGVLPGIFLGSIISYLLAQYIDIFIFEFLRKLTRNRYLWLRNNISTLCSQLVDTILVITITWIVWPILDGNPNSQPINWETWKWMVLGQYFFKGTMAIIETPLMYMGVYYTKKYMKTS